MAQTRIEIFIEISDAPCPEIKVEIARDSHQESHFRMGLYADRPRNGEEIADKLIGTLESIVVSMFAGVSAGDVGGDSIGPGDTDDEELDPGQVGPIDVNEG